jgi:hypothetical protein
MLSTGIAVPCCRTKSLPLSSTTEKVSSEQGIGYQNLGIIISSKIFAFSINWYFEAYLENSAVRAGM